MIDNLEDLIGRLAAEPVDRSLAHVEDEVARAIGRKRREADAVAALALVRVTSVGLAMAIGVAFGGVAASRSAVVRTPAAMAGRSASLAPSALFGDAP